MSAPASFAQNKEAQRGNRVYILQSKEKGDIGGVVNDFKEALRNWSYWKVVNSEKEADILIDVNIDTHRGVTWTSWGGKSVSISATVLSKEKETIWRSHTYKRSPNGSNGFNSGEAVVRKVIAEMKKAFR
ncbi:hypothetical protein GCM10027516_35810 [Niabella aquatica]